MSLRTFGRWDTPGMKLVVEASAKGPTVLTRQAAIPVGALPAGWTRRRLGDLGRTYGGLAGKTGADFGRGSARYITFLNVMTNPVIDPRLFEPVVVHPYEHQNEVRKGDLFFNGSSETPEEVAMCSLLDHDVNGVYLNSFCFGFRLDDPDVDGLYLVNFFRSHEGRKLVLPLAQGFTRHNLSKRALLNLTIPVPPLGEQRAICRALTDADHFNQELDGLIAKKRAMKQGAMQQLLTGRTRLPGFSEPCPSRALGELGRWRGGMTPSMADPGYWQDGSIPWVSSSDISQGRIARVESYITQRAVDETSVPVMPPGSVLVVMRSGILRRFLPVARTSIAMAVNQDIRALAPGPEHDPAFLEQSLIDNQQKILTTCLKAGTTVESIDTEWFHAFRITVPTLTEQRAIASVLVDMDSEISALDQQLEKAQAVRQGMAQALLSGRVRLTEPEPGTIAS